MSSIFLEFSEVWHGLFVLLTSWLKVVFSGHMHSFPPEIYFMKVLPCGLD